MDLTLKQKILIISVTLLTSFAAGRYSAPEKIKTEIKTVEVVREVEKAQTNDKKHQTSTTKEVDRPDGTKEITTTTTENDDNTTQTSQASTDQKTTDATKEVERGSSKVTIAALGAINLSNLTSSPLSYGLSLSKPVLGPVTLQAFGLSNLTLGMGIGLSF